MNIVNVIIFSLFVFSSLAQNPKWALIVGEDDVSKIIELKVLEELQASGFLFVDRSQIREIIEEQEIELLFRKRKSSLSLLKADRLIFFSKKSTGEYYLHITDTKYHAKLLSLRFSKNLSADVIIEECIQSIKKCKENYEHGIKQIFGVSPFLPKNLSHDYDDLSTVYKNILENFLAQEKGIAVLEMKEALSIAKEQALTGENKTFISPVFINAEYNVDSKLNSIEISINVKSLNNSRSFIERKLNLAKVPYFLQEISNKLLAKKAILKRSMGQQLKWLIKKSDQFERLGMFDNTASMKEAALLIKPNDFVLRKELLEIYRKVIKSAFDSNHNKRYENLNFSLRVFKRQVTHIDYLVANKLLSFNEAVKLLNTYINYCNVYSVNSEKEKLVYDQLNVLKSKCFWHNFNLLDSLRYEPSKEYNNALKSVFYYHFLVGFLRRGLTYSKVELKEIERLIKYVDLDSITSNYNITNFFTLRKSNLDTDSYFYKNFSEKSWLGFIKRIKNSDKEGLKLLGRYAEINWYFESNFSESKSKKLIAQIQQLKEDWLTLPVINLPSYRKLSDFRKSNQVYSKLNNLLVSLGAQKVKDRKRNYSLKQYPMLGKLRYEKIKLKFESSKANEEFIFDVEDRPGKNEITTTSNTDLIWGAKGVWQLLPDGSISPLLRLPREVGEKKSHFVRIQGVTKEVISYEDERAVEDVQWDGQYIWIMTKKYQKSIEKFDGKCCLKVYSESGRFIGQLEAKSFSRHNASLKMKVLEVGKVFLLGNLKPDNRAWFSIVELSEGKLKNNEFFNAKYLITSKTDRKVIGNPNLAFQPNWVHLFQRQNNHKPFVIIKRDRMGRSNENYHPLIIDIEKLKVSVMPLEVRAYGDQFSQDGVLYLIGSSSLDRYKYVEEEQKWLKLSNIKDMNTSYSDDKFIDFGRNLYKFGKSPYLINKSTSEIEPLVNGVVYKPLIMKAYSKSRNFNLIGYQLGGLLYEISVDPEHFYTLNTTYMYPDNVKFWGGRLDGLWNIFLKVSQREDESYVLDVRLQNTRGSGYVSYIVELKEVKANTFRGGVYSLKVLSEKKAILHAKFDTHRMANLVGLEGDFNNVTNIDLDKVGWRKGAISADEALRFIGD